MILEFLELLIDFEGLFLNSYYKNENCLWIFVVL